MNAIFQEKFGNRCANRIDNEDYINAAYILNVYKKIYGNSRKTQKIMVEELKLEHIIRDRYRNHEIIKDNHKR